MGIVASFRCFFSDFVSLPTDDVCDQRSSPKRNIGRDSVVTYTVLHVFVLTKIPGSLPIKHSQKLT